MSEQTTAFRLAPEERKKIEKLRKKEKDARIYSRYLALLWLDDGCSVEEVAARLDRDPSTVRKWLKLFKKSDPDGRVCPSEAGSGRGAP
jgi:transposase-like protein